ncbi:unnamed protein product, partial [Rotaria socialis]
NCAVFGTAVGGISATGATTCCNYCCTPPSLLGALGALISLFISLILLFIFLIRLARMHPHI